MSEWQPIETAPKDGSIIIVPGGIACWKNYRGTLSGGWHSITGVDYPGKPIQYELRHWMPLPEPPK